MSSDASWYYADGQQSVGPMTLQQLKAALPKVGGKETMVFGPGLVQWTEAKHVDDIMAPASAMTISPGSSSTTTYCISSPKIS